MFIRRLILAFLGPMSLLGCQRYVPEPLDLAGHGRAAAGRDPASAGVGEYARRFAGPDRGEPIAYDASDGLSLREAEAVALFFNPTIRAARLRARVPRVGAAEAGRWEDPEIRVDAERIIEGVEHPWVLGGVLNLTLPLAGRLKVEKQKALAEADAEQLRVLVEEQTLLADLRASWLEWSATVEQIALTKALLNELDGFVTTAERLRAAGELDPLDARLFRIERLTRSARLQTLESQAAAQEIELKGRLGLLATARVTLNPSLTYPFRPFPATGEWARHAEAHPRVRVARAEYELSERSLNLEIRKQYPDLSVGGGFGTDEAVERVLGGVGLPLPLWNRNRRAIAEARAAREAARASAEAEYERVLSEIARAQASLDGATRRLRFVETELAPLVDEQLAAARQLGRLGNYNTLVLLEALKAAYDAKDEVVQARLNVGLSNARLGALSSHVVTEGRVEEDDRP